MSLKCPRCGKYSPDRSIFCDCGYSFPQERLLDQPHHELGDAAPPDAWSRFVSSRTRKTLTPVFWVIAGIGFALPFATGMGVQIYFSAKGRGTIPASYFIGNPGSIVIVLVAAVFWALPFIVLGVVAGPILRADTWPLRLERAVIVVSTFFAGILGAVRLYWDVFLQFDVLVIFTPVPLYYIMHMAIGSAVGLAVAMASAGARTLIGMICARRKRSGPTG